MDIKALADETVSEISKVISGKEKIIRKLFVCLICGGHVLFDDIPGTGKTTMARSLAQTVDADFSRIQFTADLLPSDITGINYYNMKSSEFEFRKGGIFGGIVLADEINRAAPRTQSALLEAMEERQVTADGTTHSLPFPFMVIATQNPVETQGTYPLPEAQLDRFLMKLTPGYPSHDEEMKMVRIHGGEKEAPVIKKIITLEMLKEMQSAVCNMRISDDVSDYAVRLTQKSRSDQNVRLGISPRGTLALIRAAKGYGACMGREFVTPDDIKNVFVDVCAHRLIMKNPFGSISPSAVCRKILSETPVPTEKTV